MDINPKVNRFIDSIDGGVKQMVDEGYMLMVTPSTESGTTNESYQGTTPVTTIDLRLKSHVEPVAIYRDDPDALEEYMELQGAIEELSHLTDTLADLQGKVSALDEIESIVSTIHEDGDYDQHTLSLHSAVVNGITASLGESPVDVSGSTESLTHIQAMSLQISTESRKKSSGIWQTVIELCKKVGRAIMAVLGKLMPWRKSGEERAKVIKKNIASGTKIMVSRSTKKEAKEVIKKNNSLLGQVAKSMGELYMSVKTLERSADDRDAALDALGKQIEDMVSKTDKTSEEQRDVVRELQKSSKEDAGDLEPLTQKDVDEFFLGDGNSKLDLTLKQGNKIVETVEKMSADDPKMAAVAAKTVNAVGRVTHTAAETAKQDNAVAIMATTNLEKERQSLKNTSPKQKV